VSIETLLPLVVAAISVAGAFITVGLAAGGERSRSRGIEAQLRTLEVRVDASEARLEARLDDKASKDAVNAVYKELETIRRQLDALSEQLLRALERGPTRRGGR
jgi:hypothetical protein